MIAAIVVVGATLLLARISADERDGAVFVDASRWSDERERELRKYVSEYTSDCSAQGDALPVAGVNQPEYFWITAARRRSQASLWCSPKSLITADLEARAFENDEEMNEYLAAARMELGFPDGNCEFGVGSAKWTNAEAERGGDLHCGTRVVGDDHDRERYVVWSDEELRFVLVLSSFNHSSINLKTWWIRRVRGSSSTLRENRNALISTLRDRIDTRSCEPASANIVRPEAMAQVYCNRPRLKNGRRVAGVRWIHVGKYRTDDSADSTVTSLANERGARGVWKQTCAYDKSRALGWFSWEYRSEPKGTVLCAPSYENQVLTYSTYGESLVVDITLVGGARGVDAMTGAWRSQLGYIGL